MRKIIVRKKDNEPQAKDDFFAHLDGTPAIWGTGKTISEAIGDCVQTHADHFDIKIEFEDKAEIEAAQFTRLRRIHNLGGERNNPVLVFCENEDRKRIAEKIVEMFHANTVKVVTTNEDYATFEAEPKTIFVVDCVEDSEWLRRFNLIKRIPETTLCFICNPKDQRQELFERGELQRFMTVFFAEPQRIEG